MKHISCSLIIFVTILVSPFLLPEAIAQLSFQVNYVYRAGGKGDLVPLEDGATLHSGDHYKIIFTPDSDCHVYIFQIDSADHVFQLFPMKQFNNVRVDNVNPVKSGIRYNLPNTKKAYELDNKVGMEKIYFIATSNRSDELEDYIDFIKEPTKKNSLQEVMPIKEQLETKLNRLFKSRGIKIVKKDTPFEVTWGSQNDLFNILENRLNKFCDGCFHVLRFSHK